MRLTQDDFLNAYTKLLTSANKKGGGSVMVTFKRYCMDGEAKLPRSNNATGVYLNPEESKAEPSTSTSTSSASTKDKTPASSTKSGGNSKKGGASSKKGGSSSNKGGAKKPSSKPKRDRTVETGEPSCLVHARLGTEKISTVVPWKDAVDFQSQFGTIFRAHTTSSLVPKGGVSKRLARRKQASAGVKGTSKAGPAGGLGSPTPSKK